MLVWVILSGDDRFLELRSKEKKIMDSLKRRSLEKSLEIYFARSLKKKKNYTPLLEIEDVV
jgi:hypothetical protein